MNVQDDVKPGLDRTDILKPGQGWAAVKVQAITDVPLRVDIEAGKKLTSDLAVYADVWDQPTKGVSGVNVAARIKSNIDLFAGVFDDRQGNAGIQLGAGVKFG